MPGISPKLPMARDTQDGYALTKTYNEVVRQNLKHLILTVPGERIMDPTFGVGLKKFLFEQNTSSTWSSISAKIHEQVSKFMPYIKITNIDYTTPEEQDPILKNSNLLPVKIYYAILPLGTHDVIDFAATESNFEIL